MSLNQSKAKTKIINYAESDSEGTDGDDVFQPKAITSRARASKRRKVSESADEDTYEHDDSRADLSDGIEN